MRKALLFAVAVALFAACATPKSSSSSKTGKGGKNAKAGSDAESAPLPPGAEVTEASLRGTGFDVDPELKAVRFDYDSAQLSGEALDALKANAAEIKSRKGMEFLVAGHCDERGTIAYNLALGQKRAKEVRDYYIRLGVDGRKVATISYGKEQPECTDSTEECWSNNRRAVTGARKAGKGAGAAK